MDGARESWYERWILPWAVDLACGVGAVRRQREKVVPLAVGRVLEVGMGTGRNIPFYDRAKIERIVGLDPARAMHRLARKRIARARLDVEMLGLSAQAIPAGDATFDSVVMTYTLCSIPEPLPALREMRRVLKPGGKLLFCEHGRAPDASVRWWQDHLQPLWGPLAGGCQLGRDIPALLREAGFALPRLEAAYIPGGPRFVSYNFWGEARGA